MIGYQYEYLPIGIEKMSKSIGLKRGEILAIAGRSGFGKTSLACRMIYNLAVIGKYRIGVFSLEMNSNGFAKWILHKKSEEKEDYDYVKEMSKASENRIWIDDTPGISVKAIKDKCYEMKKKQGGLDYIFIDYFQLISLNIECEWAQKVAVISRNLEVLAKQLNCVIIVTTQLSRRIDGESLKPRPNKSRRLIWYFFKNTILGEYADVAIILYRDEMYYPDSPYKGKVEAIIGKNSDGQVDDSFLFDIETEL